MESRHIITKIYSDSLTNDERFEQLMNEVLPIINLLTQKYQEKFIKIMEPSDINQLCMMELVKVVTTFDQTTPESFYNYFRVCAERSLLKVWKMNKLDKRKTIYYACSLDKELKEDSGFYGIDLIENNVAEFEPCYNMEQKRLQSIERKMNSRLSVEEVKIFDLYKQGYTYKAIAKMLGKSEKKIDNTIQKIRKIYRPMLYR